LPGILNRVSSAGGVIGFVALIGSGSFSKIADATLN